MTSSTFNVGGHDWVIEFHPDDDKTEASEEYLSLYLKLVSPREARATYEFKLLTQGFERYMKRSELETSNYLKDDCLNFHCTIRVVKTRVEEGKHYVIPVPPSDMSRILREDWSNTVFIKISPPFSILFPFSFNIRRSIMAPKRARVSKPNADDDEISISSSSQWICETVKGRHEFKIKGYSMGIEVGESMTSSTFNVGGHDWVIEFHPDDDKTEASEEYLSLYLKLVSPREARATYEFKLLTQGFERYIKRSELETSNYLKDDCLNFHCTIRVVKTRVEEGKHYVIPVPPSDMSQNLKGLLESGTGSDVTIQVRNEFFKAHKLILAARSPVFKAMFFGLVGNPDMETVTIEEFDPFAFKAMLLYLYSDELPEARELSDSDSTCTSTIIMQHLLIAADRFGLARLKLMCEAKLCQEITANNVATTLVLADKHQFLQLKTICLNFAAKAENVEEVLKSDEFAHLEKNSSSLLIDMLKTGAVVNGK
ncbi:hypothetical protein MKW92_053035 [Papaver armeniacum]|nr:hypothetical protein MKW92_053035 [Papaver armeniacum]